MPARPRSRLKRPDDPGQPHSVTLSLADAMTPAERHSIEELKAGIAERRGIVSGEELYQLEEELTDRIESLLDRGRGACLLRLPTVPEIVEHALMRFDGVRYDMLAWCIMPNHVRAVFYLREGTQSDRVIQSWKGHSSRMVNRVLSRSGTLWQHDHYGGAIGDDQLRRAVENIRNDPSRAGMEEWPWVRVYNERMP